MAVDMSATFAEFLAGNRGLDPADPEHRRTPDYGVVATLEDSVLAVELTFRRGSAYCCYEWGCHAALLNGKRWERLRRLFAAHGVTAPPQIELRLTCVIEKGAIFFDFARPDRGRRGWYAFAPETAQRYEATAVEAAASGG